MSTAPVETHDIAKEDGFTPPDVVIIQPLDMEGKFVNIEVPGEFICKVSDLIKEIVRDDGSNDPIPLPNARVDKVNLILDFYTRYIAEPFNIPKNDEDDQDKWFVLKEGNLVKNGFPEWAEKILDDIPLTEEPIKDHGHFKGLFDLLSTAEYLMCDKLFFFIILKISSMTTGKSDIEISILFHKENDFDEVDEFHYEDKSYTITNKETGATREVVKKIKVWTKITRETVRLINSTPV